MDPETQKLKPGLETLGDPLLPFFKQKPKDGVPRNGVDQPESFWTSVDVADTKTLGYNYLDIKENPEKTREHFRAMHNWSISLKPEPHDRTPVPPPELKPLNLGETQVYLKHPEYLEPSEFHIDAPPTPVVHAEQAAKSISLADAKSLKSNETETSPSLKRREWFVDDTVER